MITVRIPLGILTTFILSIFLKSHFRTHLISQSGAEVTQVLFAQNNCYNKAVNTSPACHLK